MPIYDIQYNNDAAGVHTGERGMPVCAAMKYVPNEGARAGARLWHVMVGGVFGLAFMAT